eukprot:3401272-Prymnesium_polylepis.1
MAHRGRVAAWPQPARALHGGRPLRGQGLARRAQEHRGALAPRAGRHRRLHGPSHRQEVHEEGAADARLLQHGRAGGGALVAARQRLQGWRPSGCHLWPRQH